MPTAQPAPEPDDLAAVVGAAGFIGRHVVAALTAAGVTVVRCTRDRPALAGGALAPEVAAVVAAGGTVVHVAGGINPAVAERDPAAVAAEVDELTRLLDALAEAAAAAVTAAAGGAGRVRPVRVVLAGSGGTVYDPTATPPYAEDDPVGPTTAYGRAKHLMEERLRAHRDRFEPVALRLANVYGPGQRVGTGQGVVGHWFEAAAAGRPLELFGDPDTTRDYVYVGDVAEAVLAVHRSVARLPEVINIGSGVATSLGHLGALVRDVVDLDGVDLRITPGRGFDRPVVALDVRLAAERLGWSPRTTLEQGLAATWAARPGGSAPR